MKYGALFLVVAALLYVTAAIQGGWYYLLLWPALSFATIAIGYFTVGPAIYGKSKSGLLSPFSQFVLLPFLLYLWSVWHITRLLMREAAFNQLTENIIIGRRLLSHELPDTIDHVIDLTCEFAEPVAQRTLSYHCFQILDGEAPPVELLREWIVEATQLPGNIYIHCAQGHGRTGLFTAALLIHTGYSATPDNALKFIKTKRPLVRLNHTQRMALNQFHKT